MSQQNSEVQHVSELKPYTEHICKVDTKLDNELPTVVQDLEIDPEAEKSALRKIDWRLIPVFTAIFGFALIDRTNYGGARIAGMDEALDLDVGNRAAVALMILFVGYVLFELPSNIIMKKLGPRIWLSGISIGFGLLTIGCGLVRNWGTLTALRLLLGIFEAGLLPGVFYLMGAWYRRYEMQRRISYFLQSTFMISTFSNVLSYGLTQIATEPERGGWRYIFIIEGAITIAIAICMYFVVTDFPQSKGNKFLTPKEKEVVRRRVIADRGEFEAEKITWKVLRYTFTRWHMWTTGFLYMTAAAGSYSWLIFNPIILRRSMGFSLVNSYMLTVPPAALSTITTFVVAHYSDKHHVRGPVCWFGTLFGIWGLGMVGFCTTPAARYAGIFIGEIGTNAYIATCVVWGQNNMRSDGCKAILSSFQVGCAGMGAIIASLVFRQQDAPNYIPGIAAVGACLICGFFVSLITAFFLHRANKEADSGKRVLEGAIGFRYTW